MCSGPDLDPCDVWKLTSHKARKEHRCECCHTTINPGERYWRLFTVYEGEAGSEKSCNACNEAAEEFAAGHYVRSGPGSMRDLYQQCVMESEDDGDTESWAKWTQVLEDIDARGRALC